MSLSDIIISRIVGNNSFGSKKDNAQKWQNLSVTTIMLRGEVHFIIYSLFFFSASLKGNVISFSFSITALRQ